MDRYEAEQTDLFALPNFSAQEELLSLTPQFQTFHSKVPNPVAKVVLSLPLLHMNQAFDYEVPAKFADVPVGARVAVQFGGQEVRGYITERTSQTQAGRKLRPLRKVISPIPVLQKNIYELAQTVAKAAICPLADCLRLAIPPRQAAVEKDYLSAVSTADFTASYAADLPIWENYQCGGEVLKNLQTEQAGKTPTTSLIYLGAHDSFAQMILAPIQIAAAAGKSALLILPTAQQVAELARYLQKKLPTLPIAQITAQDDPPRRYRNFLRILNGEARVVIGTRSAAWAPLKNLGFISILDENHSAYVEKRRPQIHTCEILYYRQKIESVPLLSFNYGPALRSAWRKANSAGWSCTKKNKTTEIPQILAANSFLYEGAPWARFPDSVFQVMRAALKSGPVLVVVPQTGYIPLTACEKCRELALCPHCGGYLQISAPHSPPSCSRCASSYRNFHCQKCGGNKLRAVRIGSHRTAQEIGRAFPGVIINIARAGEDIELPNKDSRIVVSTPRNFSTLPQSFAAGVLLDAGYLLRSGRLESESYFLRAVTQILPALPARAAGGKLLIVGDVPSHLLQVLQNGDFSHWEATQLAERSQLQLPPTCRWYELRGVGAEIKELLTALRNYLPMPSPAAEKDATLDVLLQGGLSSVIPGITLLGPHIEGEDTILYMRFDTNARPTIQQDLYSAFCKASIKKIAPGVRVNINPIL